MLDIEPDLDEKLRALYEHYGALEPPANLARITSRASRSGHKALSRVVAVVGVAAIAAGILLFARELSGHRFATTPTPITHPVSPANPVWSPNPLPSPHSPLGLYGALPFRNWLPALEHVLVPVTQGMGRATVTIVPQGELYIQYACAGDSSLVVTVVGVPGPKHPPSCTASLAHPAFAGTSLPEYPNQVLPAGDLGKPVTITISTGPSTTWAIFIAESVAPAPLPVTPAGSIVISANPWSGVDEENGDLYVLSPGAAPRRVIGTDGDGIAQECPAFSPDGQQLAYGEANASATETNNRGLWPVSDRAVVVVAVSDLAHPVLRVTLPTAAGHIACPEWSPDGSHLAFRVDNDLWVVDSTTGKATVLSVGATPWGEDGFAWSRDGSRVAVEQPGKILVVPIDGSTPTEFSVETGTYSLTRDLGWTADDDAIVYLSTDPASNAVAVRRVDPDGTNDTQLAPIGIADYTSAAISPDGTRVAYIDGIQNVVTMDTSGRNVVEVALPPSFDVSGLLWSPDGKRLLLSSIDGVVSVAIAPGSPPIVYANGDLSDGLNLENTWSDVTWQPVKGPTA
jgi:hypothetical protein